MAWAKSGRVGERQSIFRVKLNPVLFKIQTLLAAIRAVNWSWRDWQAQTGDAGRDRLPTHVTLHTMLSSHKRCFGSSIAIFSLDRHGSTPEPTLQVVNKARAPYWLRRADEG
jgi:hypothetical protein